MQAKSLFSCTAVALAVLAAAAHVPSARAATQSVFFDELVETTAVADPLAAGDTLFVDTFVSGPTGALSQSVGFWVGAGVGSFTGAAAWEVDAVGPRLVGVNIDLFDASNNLVASDDFQGLLGSFAVSSIAGGLAPGYYTLVATGNAVRDASLDISLTMAPVPEPASIALLMAGLGVVGFSARRRAAAQRQEG